MALKRKLELDTTDLRLHAKQPKLVPFPNCELDTDVAMSDASMSDFEPLSLSIQQPYHLRLPSDASYSSSNASDSPRDCPIYPAFDLYPLDAQTSTGSSINFGLSMDFTPKPVGLLQPRSPSFTHHGQNCSQIPKLRIACSPGLSGQRTMWAHCEQCGAIEMVNTD
ncbi:hypothetical protein AcW1_009198 [Taiwanofungus camphoratus]|nr:hypothetical protein AcV5_007222 [Antrodia cinnamomea]KAI0949656.1 hypothetical protein AcW1_009198 [Antrodia cinnamomea]